MTVKKTRLLAGVMVLMTAVTIHMGSVQAADGSGAVRIKFGQTAVQTQPVPSESKGQEAMPIKNVQLVWKEIPSAVRYQVVILKSAEDTAANIALTYNQVYTNGVTVDLSSFGAEAAGFYWKVCPLDYNGIPVGNLHFS